RKSCIVPTVQIVSLEDVLGKETQLPRGAAALAIQPCLRQAGLLGADQRDGFGPLFNFISDRVEESGALVPGRGSIFFKACFGCFAGARHMFRRTDAEMVGRSMCGIGCKSSVARDPFTRNQVLAVGSEGHIASPSSFDISGRAFR